MLFPYLAWFLVPLDFIERERVVSEFFGLLENFVAVQASLHDNVYRNLVRNNFFDLALLMVYEAADLGHRIEAGRELDTWVVGRNDQTKELSALLIEHLLVHVVIDDVDVWGVHLEFWVAVIPSQQGLAPLLDHFDVSLCWLRFHFDILWVVYVLGAVRELCCLTGHGIRYYDDVLVVFVLNSVSTEESDHLVPVVVTLNS